MPERTVIIKRTFVDDQVREVKYFLKGRMKEVPLIRIYSDGSVKRGKFVNGKVENLASVDIESLGAMELDAFRLSETQLKEKYLIAQVSDLRLSSEKNKDSPALWYLH